MADIVDMANEIEREHLEGALAQAARSIPLGVAGECEGCLEPMPRLVGGLCGYCRDGRVNPRTTSPATLPTKDSAVMATAITFTAPADMLAVIEQRAKVAGSKSRAVLDMIQEGQRDAALLASARDTRAAPQGIAGLSTHELLSEVADRLSAAGGDAEALAAAEQRASEATARAETAERKLASLKAALET